MYNSIPTICILTLVRHDLLKRLISSIDYDVDNCVILFQGGHNNFDFDSVKNNFIKKITFLSVDFNIGCSRGWNYMIKNYPSSYWLICGDDTYFEKGTLNIICDFMNKDNNEDLVWACFNEKDINNNIIKSSNFSSFIFTNKIYNNVGLFDENIYPAYYEDLDLWQRLVKSNERREVISNAFIISGDDNFQCSCSYYSVDENCKKKMDTCKKNNEIYFFEKWHDGEYNSPFNNLNYSLKDSIPHENYYKNQLILTGHSNEPIFSLIKVIEN
jgi:hypothetical protein